jgi:hypothetical protein
MNSGKKQYLEYLKHVVIQKSNVKEQFSLKKIKEWEDKMKNESGSEEFVLADFNKGVDLVSEIGRKAPRWEMCYDIFMPTYWGIKNEKEINELAHETAIDIISEVKKQLREYKMDNNHIVSLPNFLGIYWYIVRKYLYLNQEKEDIKSILLDLEQMFPEFKFLKEDYYFSKKYNIVIQNLISVVTIKTINYTMATVVRKRYAERVAMSPLCQYTEIMGMGNVYIGEKNPKEIMDKASKYEMALYQLEIGDLDNFFIFPMWENSNIMIESWEVFNQCYNDGSKAFGWILNDWRDSNSD